MEDNARSKNSHCWEFAVNGFRLKISSWFEGCLPDGMKQNPTVHRNGSARNLAKSSRKVLSSLVLGIVAAPESVHNRETMNQRKRENEQGPSTTRKSESQVYP